MCSLSLSWALELLVRILVPVRFKLPRVNIRTEDVGHIRILWANPSTGSKVGSNRRRVGYILRLIVGVRAVYVSSVEYLATLM